MSPLLFLFAIEPLVMAICQLSEVTGITIDRTDPHLLLSFYFLQIWEPYYAL